MRNAFLPGNWDAFVSGIKQEKSNWGSTMRGEMWDLILNTRKISRSPNPKPPLQSSGVWSSELIGKHTCFRLFFVKCSVLCSRSGVRQSSYLSQISQIIFLEKKIVMWRNFGKCWEILGDLATIYALSFGEKLSPSTFVDKYDKYEVCLL